MLKKVHGMIKICLSCKKEFHVFPYKIKEGKGKFCSTKCYWDSLEKVEKIEVICKCCGKKFITTKNRLNANRGKYCSNKCKNVPRKQTEVSCKYCSKKFLAKNSELKRNGDIYCSRECAAKDYKNHYSGEQASNWKGGKQRNKHNGEYKYSDWRLKVYERDNFTCQECGVKGGKLNAHHQFTWAKYPSLRFELWNGITLCEQCHKQEHSKKRRIYHGS